MNKILFMSLFLATNSIIAQNTYEPSTTLRSAYMGSITNPGFKIGIERPYKVIEVNKNAKTIFKERGLAFNLGMYNQKTFHANYFLQAEWLMRRQKSSGLFYDFSIGAGVSKTFLNGATFEIDSKGNATKVNWAGDTYILTSIAWAIGYNLDLKKENNLKFYMKPSVMVLFPYNNFFHVRPTFEIGVIQTLNNFWKAKTSIKKKN